MGLFQRNKNKNSDKAPVKEIVFQNEELKATPKRLHSQQPVQKTNRIGRALPDPYTTGSNPRVVDCSTTPQNKQRFHMDRLFNISTRYVEEIPPERRQSLTTATATTDDTPHSAIPFGTRKDPIIRRLKEEAAEKREKDRSEDRKEKDANEVQTVHTSCSVFELFSENFSFHPDTWCGTATKAEKKKMLSDPPVNPIPIPREISFSKKTNSWRSEGLCEVGGSIKEVGGSIEKDPITKPTSLMDRLKRKKSDKQTVLPKLRVFVDKPKFEKYSCCASVDHSALTTPSIGDGMDVARDLQD